MKKLSINELKSLSFPDCIVSNMIISFENKIFKLTASRGWIDIEGRGKIGPCEVVIKDWNNINIKLYETQTKKWLILNEDTLDELVDICEFIMNDEIILRGFGRNTGQWIEYKFENANLEVKMYS